MVVFGVNGFGRGTKTHEDEDEDGGGLEEDEGKRVYIGGLNNNNKEKGCRLLWLLAVGVVAVWSCGCLCLGADGG